MFDRYPDTKTHSFFLMAIKDYVNMKMWLVYSLCHVGEHIWVSKAVSSSSGKFPWLYQGSSVLVGFFATPPHQFNNVKLIFRETSIRCFANFHYFVSFI